MKLKNKEPFIIKEPLVIMFVQDDKIVCHIHPAKDVTHEHYGIAICDLVLHVSKAFKVSEDDVWKWVDMERDRPTAEIEQAN